MTTCDIEPNDPTKTNIIPLHNSFFPRFKYNNTKYTRSTPYKNIWSLAHDVETFAIPMFTTDPTAVAEQFRTNELIHRLDTQTWMYRAQAGLGDGQNITYTNDNMKNT